MKAMPDGQLFPVYEDRRSRARGKNRVLAPHRSMLDSRFTQMRFEKINFAGAEMSENVVQAPATRVVDGSNLAGAARRWSANVEPKNDGPPVENTGFPIQNFSACVNSAPPPLTISPFPRSSKPTRDPGNFLTLS
jgi:hypothetical protein